VTCTDSSDSVKLFADDVKLYTVISDEFSCDKLRTSLDNIYSWSDHWQLKLSPTKWMVDYENQVSRRFVELRKTPLKFSIFKCIILRNYCMDYFENLTTSSFQAILWMYIIWIINLSAILI